MTHNIKEFIDLFKDGYSDFEHYPGNSYYDLLVAQGAKAAVEDTFSTVSLADLVYTFHHPYKQKDFYHFNDSKRTVQYRLFQTCYDNNVKKAKEALLDTDNLLSFDDFLDEKVTTPEKDLYALASYFSNSHLWYFMAVKDDNLILYENQFVTKLYDLLKSYTLLYNVPMEEVAPFPLIAWAEFITNEGDIEPFKE